MDSLREYPETDASTYPANSPGIWPVEKLVERLSLWSTEGLMKKTEAPKFSGADFPPEGPLSNFGGD